MGKKTNERRKQIFEELKTNGKLDRPAIRPTKPVPPPKKKTVEIACCLTKYGDAIPTNFKQCYGCPLTEADASARVG